MGGVDQQYWAVAGPDEYADPVQPRMAACATRSTRSAMASLKAARVSGKNSPQPAMLVGVLKAAHPGWG